MTDDVLELANFTLADGATEAQLLSASDAFQRDFLGQQNGFIRRDMIRRSDGTYTDVILWQSRADADAVFGRAQNAEAASAYFACMKIDPEAMDTGVEICTILRSFAKAG